jgi:prevent-host-death family protein
MPTIKSHAPEIVTAADANRRFSELLRGVREEGKRYIVTSHGRAVAQLTPADGVEDREAAHRAADEALRAHWRDDKGVSIEPWTREELYERDPRK